MKTLRATAEKRAIEAEISRRIKPVLGHLHSCAV